MTNVEFAIAFLTDQKNKGKISEELLELHISILKEDDKLKQLSAALTAKDLNKAEELIKEFRISTFCIPEHESPVYVWTTYNLYLEVVANATTPQVIFRMVKAGFSPVILETIFRKNEQDAELLMLAAMFPVSWERFRQQAREDSLQALYKYFHAVPSETIEEYADKMMITFSLVILAHAIFFNPWQETFIERLLESNQVIFSLTVNAYLHAEFNRNLERDHVNYSKLAICGQLLRVPGFLALQQQLSEHTGNAVPDYVIALVTILILFGYSMLYSLYVIPALRYLASNYNVTDYASFNYVVARKELAKLGDQPKMKLHAFEAATAKAAQLVIPTEISSNFANNKPNWNCAKI